MFHEDVTLFIGHFLFKSHWCMHSDNQVSNIEFEGSCSENQKKKIDVNYHCGVTEYVTIESKMLLWSIGPSFFATLNKVSAVQNSGTRTNNLPKSRSAGKWKPSWCNSKMNGSYERIYDCSAVHGTMGTECFFTKNVLFCFFFFGFETNDYDELTVSQFSFYSHHTYKYNDMSLVRQQSHRFDSLRRFDSLSSTILQNNTQSICFGSKPHVYRNSHAIDAPWESASKKSTMNYLVGENTSIDLNEQ